MRAAGAPSSARSAGSVAWITGWRAKPTTARRWRSTPMRCGSSLPARAEDPRSLASRTRSSNTAPTSPRAARDVQGLARALGVGQVGVPPDRAAAAADDSADERTLHSLDLLEDGGEVGLVVGDEDLQATGHRPELSRDGLRAGILGCDVRSRVDDAALHAAAGNRVKRKGPDGKRLPRQGTPCRRRPDRSHPGARPQDQHPVAGAGGVRMTAVDLPDPDDVVGRGLRPGDVLPRFHKRAEQQRPRRTAAALGRDDEVSAAHAPNLTAPVPHPSHLARDAADDAPVVVGRDQ